MSEVVPLFGAGPASLAFCAAVVLAGGYLKGYTGFGASMLWGAGLSIVLPPVEVVPMVLLFEVTTSIALLPAIWNQIEWRSIGLLLIGTWATTPLGIYALTVLPAALLRMALALVVMTAAVLVLRGFEFRRVPGKSATVGVGMLAGVLNGSMGIVGPPVILFYFSSPLGVGIGRASIVTYFIGTDTVGSAMFASHGLIGVDVLWRTALLLPLMLVGVAAGHRGYLKTDEGTFRRAALYVLMGLAVALFLRALYGDA